MSIEENKDWLKQQLLNFYHSLQYYENKSELEKTEPLGPGPIADIYLDNEIAMERGMKDYANELHRIFIANEFLLRSIKDRKGKTFFMYVKKIIKECDRVEMPMEIITEPVGVFQEEKYGKQIMGIWVDQRSVGDSGDSYAGTVCIKIEEKEYLKFYYEM